ncbi:hypothetical protein H0H87_007548 [Tephrocybe sp. NHM501043]|nr:hypothetical protein H0H87_007548 [Tephrocybe sp. NHM501043]
MADILDVGGSASNTTTAPSSTANLTLGAPPVASRKSIVSIRPGTGHSTQTSIGNSSSAAVVIEEPLPSLSVTDANVPHDRDTTQERDKRRRVLRVDVGNTPHASPTAASSQDSDPDPLPVQHVDSGMRAASTGGTEVLSVRVELPPVYSPS